MSQRQLAGPGVTAAYISRIEAGARQPSVKALRVLARKLEVSADYLETGMDVREEHARELRLVDAELELRLAEDVRALEPKLRELLEESLAAHDAHTTTRTRLALGTVASRLGNYEEAATELEQAIEAGVLAPVSHPDVYTTLARSYAALGSPKRAVEVLERCLEDVRENAPEDAASEIRYATYLSYALSDVGELERAQEVICATLDRAEPAADPYSRVRLYWSRGRLLVMENELSLALEHFRRAIGLLEATEDTLQLARAHLSCAEILIDSGQAGEAGAHLEVAERLLGTAPDAQDVARLRTEQAKQALQLGSVDDALARAREALEVLGESEPAQQARVFTVLGSALATKGDIDESSRAYERAVTLFEGRRRFHDAAAASRAWGSDLRKAGRDKEALDVLERAADLATQASMGGPRGSLLR